MSAVSAIDPDNYEAGSHYSPWNLELDSDLQHLMNSGFLSI